jgi:predicted cobalt transporter CbtA
MGILLSEVPRFHPDNHHSTIALYSSVPPSPLIRQHIITSSVCKLRAWSLIGHLAGYTVGKLVNYVYFCSEPVNV